MVERSTHLTHPALATMLHPPNPPMAWQSCALTRSLSKQGRSQAIDCECSKWVVARVQEAWTLKRTSSCV